LAIRAKSSLDQTELAFSVAGEHLNRMLRLFGASILLVKLSVRAAEPIPALPRDPDQSLERTCFQTAQPWSGKGNLRSDVAIAYGIGPGLPDKMKTWREHGYRLHVMTGVSWGHYEDYLLGRFDGTNHEDERQTDRNGNPHRHGNSRTVFYMCPGTNYGKYLCIGVQRALEAGAEAIHLEEPEYWVQNGYEEAFKREWQSYYHEPWQPPHSSVDAQWRASKLKYFLYRRALQQVFDHVLAYNRQSGRHVRCYVPTHSLLNYAHWRIVSPESSLATLKGCDGYIAQVWTGTSRTPNLYRGQLRERTFETAFLEYGAMQNLVHGTGRTVWYLNDPVEDDPNHDWDDYRSNYESTLVASLLQPDVWRYEVAPWPERVFGGRYPEKGEAQKRIPIPPAYATELQTVVNALNDLRQSRVEWECGTTGFGVVISDSLMFQRGDPHPSDPHLSHIYGMALPLLKRGMPVAPVQLENLTAPRYLEKFRVLLLTYHGMKPLLPAVHTALSEWVKAGGVLVVCDDDSDPYKAVREWWNSDGLHYTTPREHLFELLGLDARKVAGLSPGAFIGIGKGGLFWQRDNPAQFARSAEAETRLVETLKQAAERAQLKWQETNFLLLRRGPYVLAAGIDESIAGEPKRLQGKFVNLFDSELVVRDQVVLTPGSRFFLRDLDTAGQVQSPVIASACKAFTPKTTATSLSMIVEGIPGTEAVVLLKTGKNPRNVRLAGKPVTDLRYSTENKLLWVRFANEPTPRELVLDF
jgi:hypothetical protein